MSSETQRSYVFGGNAPAPRVILDGLAPRINTGRASISSPPTPAPSPRMSMQEISSSDCVAAASEWASLAPSHLQHLHISTLDALLDSVLIQLTPAQLLQLASRLPHCLKRDFLIDLPPEIALHILSFVDDVKTLARAGQVSRGWRYLVNDEASWKLLCARRGFAPQEDDEVVMHACVRDATTRVLHASAARKAGADPSVGALASVMNLWAASSQHTPSDSSSLKGKLKAPSNHPIQPPTPQPFSYQKHFKTSHLTELNWRHSGRMLRSHRSQDAGVVTSLAMDGQWIAVGLANSRVHVFSASTGVLARTLIGHDAGVWCLWLVSRGGATNHERQPQTSAEEPETESASEGDSWVSMLPQTLRAGIGLSTIASASSPTELSDSSSSSSSSDMPFQSVFDSLQPPPSESTHAPAGGEDPSARQSDPCNASRGWGQTNALVVSGGCDKRIRVWDIKSGFCLYVLRGHTSTIRCMKVFHGRPVAVSGSRDRTLRVWDVQKGTLLRTLEGHTDSVRCLDVFGNQVVSGSYDCTVRLWDVDTGECLRVFNGHYHQVYTVAFDGERIVSGGLDTTVRVWSASAGSCLALLQCHTALVCQLQLSSRTNTVVTGSADGRIIIFRIAPAYPGARTGAGMVPTLTPDALESPPSSPPAPPIDNEGDSNDGASEYRIWARVQAHSSSVTGLQFSDCSGRPRVVSGGNDGRVQLWEVGGLGTSGRDQGADMRLVRDLTESCEGLWKVAFRGDCAVICCLRAGRTVLEIWSFRPVEEDL